MDRTSWLAIVLCLLVLFFYQPIIHHFYPPPPPSVSEKPSQPTWLPQSSTTEPSETPSLQPRADEIKREPNLPEERVVTLENNFIKAEFSSYGGAARSVTLKLHEAEKGERVILNKGVETPLLNLTGWTGDWTLVNYDLAQADERSVTFTRPLHFDKTGDGGADLFLTRRYTLEKNYSVKLEEKVENRGAQPFETPSYWLQAGVGAPLLSQDDGHRYLSGAWMSSEGKYHSQSISVFDEGGFLLWKTHGKPFVESDPKERLYWASAKSQFFAIILSSLTEPALRADLRKVGLTQFHSKGNRLPEGVQTRIEMPGFEVPAGGAVTREFNLYVGPKQDALLRALPFEQSKVMEFGWLGFISRPLLIVMNLIHDFVPNYGLAIIIITILLKALLWVPQTRANQSMRKMQLLSPKLKTLQEKYKDQPQKLQEEMMRLYKDYGVNPVGGCLPLLVQMPIFIGFYYMLLSAVELRHASFLWIHDLAQPDTVARLPLLGWQIPINPMPLLMGATMFWSMNLTPQPKGVDNPSAKMMKFMPLFILWICYNFSAALSLYWTVQNLLSVVQMYYNLKQPPPALEKVAHQPVQHGSLMGFRDAKAIKEEWKARKKGKK
ncbi:MAG: membrane protein insertase YidC [bacterium]